jgi:DNA-binding beta-propeller fold protein YncE
MQYPQDNINKDDNVGSNKNNSEHNDEVIIPDETPTFSEYDEPDVEYSADEPDEDKIASLHQEMLKEIESSPAHIGRILYPEFLAHDDKFISTSENRDDNREPEVESLEEDNEYEGEFLTPEEMLALSMGSKLEEKEDTHDKLAEEQLAALHEAIIEDIDARGVQPIWLLKPEDFLDKDEQSQNESETEHSEAQDLIKEPETIPEKKSQKKKKQKTQRDTQTNIENTQEVLDRIKAVTPWDVDVNEDSSSPEELMQLDLKPLLKKKDIESPVDIISPDEIGNEQEFVSQSMEKGVMVAEQFKILKVADEKRFQITYIVKDMNETGKKYFLKEIITPGLEKEELRLRRNKFRDITRLLISAKHPNLAEIYETFHENNREYSLIQNVEGLNLQKLAKMAIEPFSEKFVIKIGKQLCDALEFLHYRPQPFTLGNLTPETIIIDDQGCPNIVDYDFQRFFDPERTIDFLPDDPTKLYDEITRLSRVFFFLLTKTSYDRKSLDFQWPAGVSLKMQKLLDITCSDGQKTFGDIKAFKKAFLETQVEEGKEIEYLKKTYDFPYHKIELKWLRQKIREFASLSPLVLTTLAASIIFLVFYFTVVQPSSAEKYKRPPNPVAFIFTTDEISIIESGNFEQAFSLPVNSNISILYPTKLDIPDKQGNRKTTDVLIVGYEKGAALNLLNLNNLATASTIMTEQTGPAKIISDERNRKLFILYPKSGNIQVMDTESLAIIDTILTDAKPVDLLYVNLEFSVNNATVKRPILITSHEDSGNIVFLDAKTGDFINNLQLPRKLNKMALSPDGKRLYVLDLEYNCLLVVNLEEKVLSKVIPIKEGTPRSIALDYLGNIWLSIPDANLLVTVSSSLDKMESINPVGTRPGKIVPDNENKRLWIINEGTKSITVMDAVNRTPRRVIRLGKRPTTISLEHSAD